MIVRVSEAQIRDGVEAEFMQLLVDLVATFPALHDGLLGHEILVDRDDARRVIYISRWRDEVAVAGFAGPDWTSAPVTFPGEDELLVRPLTLRHFVSEDAPAAKA